MAERRMLNKSIMEQDSFMDLSDSAKVLYVYLNLNADDDGFISNPRTIMRTLGSKNDDINILIAKQFVYLFDSGVIVVKDWLIHNKIRKDRRKATRSIEEFKKLTIKENDSYQLDELLVITGTPPNGNQLATNWQPNDRIGKDRLGKDRLGKSSSSNVVHIDSIESQEKKKDDNDDYLKKSFELYQSDIGQMNSIVTQKIIQWSNDLGSELVYMALERTAMFNAHNFGYTETILKQLLANKIKTREDAIRLWESKQQAKSKQVVAYEPDVPEHLRF